MPIAAKLCVYERLQVSLRGYDPLARPCAPVLSTTKEGVFMKPRIKVITPGVSNLDKSLVFYRDGSGLPTQGIIGTEFEDGTVVFFNMNDDLILALHPKDVLCKDARV